VRRLVDGNTAFLATVVLVTSSVLVRNGGVPRLDAALTLSMVAAVAAVVAGETRPRLRPLFWVAVGIGVGIKGPAAFLPVAIVAFWSVLRRRVSPWNDPWFWAGLPASVAFAAPWFVANDLRYPGVFRQTYLHDDLEATVLGSHMTTPPIRKYATDIVLEWWPWIPFMVHGAWLAVRRCAKGERDGPAPLAVAWTLAVAAAVLSIGSAYSRYLFPALPAASVFAAWSLLHIWPRIARWDLVRGVGCLAAAGTALIAFGPLQPHGEEVPDVVVFEPGLRTQSAMEPVLWLGEKVPRTLQAAAIFYADTTVRPLPPHEARTRLSAGARRIVALLPHEDGVVPAGVATRPLIRGRESDLVELTLAGRE
jgi:4-amino-4-deoxy-L-arabinose transferase-like glycosyltransferase